MIWVRTSLTYSTYCVDSYLTKNFIILENGANLLAVNGDGNMPYDICEDETTLSFIENEMAKQGVTQELIDNTRYISQILIIPDPWQRPIRLQIY